MCNSQLYEYETRGLAGRWLVFGAIHEVKQESRENTFEKLREHGLVARRRFKDDPIKLILNIKLAETFSNFRFDEILNG